jgi:hypothetical protein
MYKGDKRNLRVVNERGMLMLTSDVVNEWQYYLEMSGNAESQIRNQTPKYTSHRSPKQSALRAANRVLELGVVMMEHFPRNSHFLFGLVSLGTSQIVAQHMAFD